MIPTGLLHYLPLHALPIDQAPLLDRFHVAYVPSITLLGRVMKRRKGTTQQTEPTPLVIGNPSGWNSLPFAEQEARRVSSYLSTEPYLGEQATKEAVIKALPDASVAHFACHGKFIEDSVIESGLCLANGKVLTVREIMSMHLQADLVTLSACVTGLNRIGAGDELVGLTQAFLYAGASSVVASLWNVEDESAGEMMVDFYRRSYVGERKVQFKAVALCDASRVLRQNFPALYHWAPFILIGDWR